MAAKHKEFTCLIDPTACHYKTVVDARASSDNMGTSSLQYNPGIIYVSSKYAWQFKYRNRVVSDIKTIIIYIVSNPKCHPIN
jgi:hypothetical protein